MYVLRAGALERCVDWSARGLDGGPATASGVQLAPGDLLFFYTDGCVEAESESGEMFSSDRLESLVTAAARGSAAEVLATVEGAIAKFRSRQRSV